MLSPALSFELFESDSCTDNGICQDCGGLRSVLEPVHAHETLDTAKKTTATYLITRNIIEPLISLEMNIAECNINDPIAFAPLCVTFNPVRNRSSSSHL